MTERNGSPAALGASWAVFVDFDGTITDVDTFEVLVKHYAGEDAWRDTERGLDDGTVAFARRAAASSGVRARRKPPGSARSSSVTDAPITMRRFAPTAGSRAADYRSNDICRCAASRSTRCARDYVPA